MRWSVEQGDCLGLLRLLPSNSVDAVVTDPPAGIGFMGKEWDHDKGGRISWVRWMASVMTECLRVLKPGAYTLVWALPRTSHWTATAIEEAGFRIRDVITHHFGNGFPKTVNVSKEIDRVLGGRRTAQGKNPNHRAVSGRDYRGVYSGRNTGASEITGPGTPEAARYAGYGTGLKPATEHWILAQKPFKGVIARQVLEHGTGALNIDACRVPRKEKKLSRKLGKTTVSASGWVSSNRSGVAGKDGVGGWPSNLLLSGDAVQALDEQAGYSRSRRGKPRTGKSGDGWAMTATGSEYNDEGGKSRFFYQPKPSPKEKNAGLALFQHKTAGEVTGGRKEGSAGLRNPRAGAGRTKGARNSHPTVKSVSLMRWLIRLITPIGGLVLDPFTGSGTTGVAALQEGARFLGFEKDTTYCAIARARVFHAETGCSMRPIDAADHRTQWQLRTL